MDIFVCLSLSLSREREGEGERESGDTFVVQLKSYSKTITAVCNFKMTSFRLNYGLRPTFSHFFMAYVKNKVFYNL